MTLLIHPCQLFVTKQSCVHLFQSARRFGARPGPPSPPADAPSLVDIDGMLMAVDESGNVDIAGRIYPPHQRAR